MTLAANRAAFDRWALRPRVLVDVSRWDLAVDLLGARLAAPIGVAPMAYHQLAHPDGEEATARAAGETGLLFVVSPFASRTLEDIAAAASGPLWLQLYWLRQRGVLVDLVERAEAAGYQAIVLKVDPPRVGRRLRDLRNGFALPREVVAANIDPAVMAGTDRGRAGGRGTYVQPRQRWSPLDPAVLGALAPDALTERLRALLEARAGRGRSGRVGRDPAYRPGPGRDGGRPSSPPRTWRPERWR